MAKCNQLTSLPFKGLTLLMATSKSAVQWCVYVCMMISHSWTGAMYTLLWNVAKTRWLCMQTFNKMVEWQFGKPFVSTLFVVRPAFLVKYLEQCSIRLGFVDVDASFVFHSMMDVGITLPRLFDIYDHLFKSRVMGSVWTLLRLL